MSHKTKDSRVRTTLKRMERDVQVAQRQPLWEQRGNNPARLIGYLNLKTRDIFTVKGNYSQPMHPSYDGTRFIQGNNAHDRRVMAASAEDFTYHAG